MNRQSQFFQTVREQSAKYISPIVLGLNDALIELTGALAGFTMVLPDSRTIILAGLTTGIAATLSMAASEYLSQDAGGKTRRPWRPALVTGMTYFITVAVLLFPFIVIQTPMLALLGCLCLGAIIIIVFTFFEARIRKQSYWQLCVKMLVISSGVAVLSFILSWGAKTWWGIEI